MTIDLQPTPEEIREAGIGVRIHHPNVYPEDARHYATLLLTHNPSLPRIQTYVDAKEKECEALRRVLDVAQEHLADIEQRERIFLGDLAKTFHGEHCVGRNVPLEVTWKECEMHSCRMVRKVLDDVRAEQERIKNMYEAAVSG